MSIFPNCPPFLSFHSQDEQSPGVKMLFRSLRSRPVPCIRASKVGRELYCWHMVKILCPSGWLTCQIIPGNSTYITRGIFFSSAFFSRFSNNLPFALTFKVKCDFIVLTVFYHSADFNLDSAGKTAFFGLTLALWPTGGDVLRWPCVHESGSSRFLANEPCILPPVIAIHYPSLLPVHKAAPPPPFTQPTTIISPQLTWSFTKCQYISLSQHH